MLAEHNSLAGGLAPVIIKRMRSACPIGVRIARGLDFFLGFGFLSRVWIPSGPGLFEGLDRSRSGLFGDWIVRGLDFFSGLDLSS